MNTELIKCAISAFKDFVAACGNDVCADASENEYTVFSGSVTADKDGNVKTYSPSGELVAQIPLRPILDRGAEFANSIVDLIEADDQKRKAEMEAEAKAEAEAAETENRELDSKISELESEIRSLKLQKKPVRRF